MTHDRRDNQEYIIQGTDDQVSVLKTWFADSVVGRDGLHVRLDDNQVHGLTHDHGLTVVPAGPKALLAL